MEKTTLSYSNWDAISIREIIQSGRIFCLGGHSHCIGFFSRENILVGRLFLYSMQEMVIVL